MITRKNTNMGIKQLCPLACFSLVSSINGAVPILHSGAECCLRLQKGLYSCNGMQSIDCTIPDDNIHRNACVPGSEDSLRSLIEGSLAVLEARLLVIMTGCIVELTGDDVAAVVREYRKKGVSVVLSETAGFKGDIHQGYEWVIKSIIPFFQKSI